MKQHAKFLVRGMTLTVAALVTSTAWAQQEAAPAEPETETAESAPTQETPIRQPPSNADAAGAPPPTKVEKLVLADPDSKMYMPCRDPNESRSTDDDSKGIKPNPKAAVLSEEAAKQHGFKPSPHKVDCPTT